MMLFIVLALLSVSFLDAKPTNNAGLACPNQVNCFVDPCQVSTCDAYPNAKCVSNYCGGCNAYWYSDDKFIEECSSPMVTKPAVKSTEAPCHTVYCFVDPCAFAKCAKHPEAVCHSNYCGGCNAWFYIGSERVTCN